MPVTIIENHSELGAGTRGASLGIEAIKAVAWQKGSSLFTDYRNKIFSSFP